MVWGRERAWSRRPPHSRRRIRARGLHVLRPRFSPSRSQQGVASPMADVIKANGWKVFMVVVAVLTALGSHLGAFPWLPGWAQHTIEFCSFVASVIVAVLI